MKIYNHNNALRKKKKEKKKEKCTDKSREIIKKQNINLYIHYKYYNIM